MSIRLIIGRSGHGKTYTCLEEMSNRLHQNPQGNPLIYLVPDQMTFQSEKALAFSNDLSGIIRAQVFSFSRLAWKVLQETGGLARTHLTSVGTNMMLRKIIEKNRASLLAFQNAADKEGFIDKTAEMMAEFKRYCIEPEAFSYEAGMNRALQDKLHDLTMIYTQFQQELEGQYVDQEDYLSLLAEKISFSTYIANAEIWVDGFHSFTPNEYIVLEALMRHAAQVTFTFTMEQPYEHEPNELDLFHENARNYRTIYQMARENDLTIEQLILLSTPHRFHNDTLAFLESQYESRPAKTYEEPTNVQLAVAVNHRAEIETIARKIISLVRDEHYAYRDISLMVREPETYEDLIKTIFTDYEIPYFLDQKRPMLHHPLVEFIRSIFDTLNGNWRYEALFRAIKTDFFIPLDSFDDIDQMRTEFDELENYVLKLGLQGNRWKQDDLWESFADNETNKNKERAEQASRMLEIRNLVLEPLIRFERVIKEAKTGRDMAEGLYALLMELEVPEKLHKWLKIAEAEGDLLAAEEHDQAWKAVIAFLDEIVEVVGDEELNLELFAKLVESGLESLKFSLVPPSLDQVLIGTLDRSRYTDVKCVFLIGVNEGVLPARPIEDGLLTDEERDVLAEAGVVLAPGSTRQLLDEQFYIYLSLTTAQERLFVSYPLADEEGKSLFPSPVISRLKELFPSLEEKLWLAEPSEGAHELAFITNPNKTLAVLAGMLRNWKRGYPIAPLWWDVYNWLIHHEYEAETQLLLESLFYKNEATSLSKETTLDLYGDSIQVSVSRMERFQSCPFQQFASHGLQLKERELFKFQAPDIGQLFHEALNLIAKDLRQHNVEWASLTDKQCFTLAENHVKAIAPKMQNKILLSSNRHYYLLRKLKQVVGRAVTVLAQQARRSGFSPIGIELGFGKGSSLPPITYELDNDKKIEVAGRIDRVDQALSEQGLLLRVIDYKSSGRDLNLAEVYFGLSMQVLTYLDVVITHAPKWLGQEATPAGVLYFHIHDPIINTSEAMAQSAIEDELFKKFKMNGLVLEDTEALTLMDTEITEKDSDIIPVGFRKDGAPKKYSKIASHEEFELLRSHIRQVTKTIGTRLSSGVVDISPYRLKDNTPCRFCEYRPLCQFDQSIDGNQYRILQPEKNEDLLKKMLEERDANK